MNRKGFVFTLLAIIITGIIVTFTMISLQPVDAGQDSLRDATMLRMMAEDIESDIERGLYITSFRTLIAQIEKVIVTGNYVASYNDSFYEGMLNGTIEGFAPEILEDATFDDWLDKITELLNDRNYDFDYDILSMDQFHESPWQVSSRILIEYNLSSPNGKKGYSRIINITAQVPVIGLEDPTYYIMSLGRLSNTINMSEDNDIMFLINASLENSLYIENNMSHSFLQRLEGNYSPSEHGIESVVGGQRFKDQGVIAYDGRSSIDAVYFTDAAGVFECVVGAPEWFRIDENRVPYYSNIVNVTC